MTIGDAAVVVVIALCITWLLSRPTPVEPEPTGTLVRDGNIDHRCQPPGCVEFGGDWKVTDTQRYPQDSVWRCQCGEYWISTFYHGFSRQRGLWLEWRHAWHDELDKLGIEQRQEAPDDC